MKVQKGRLELLTERREALDKMQEIIRKAQGDKRSLHPDEKRDFEKFKAEFDFLDAAYKVRSEESKPESSPAEPPKGSKQWINRDSGNENLFFRTLKAAYDPKSVNHRAITTTSGAGAIDTDQISSTWIPFTHDRSIIDALGIVVDTSNTPNRKWPKISGKPNTQWVSEGGALTEDTGLTVTAINRTDYTLAIGPNKVSVQAFQDSDIIEDIHNNEMSGSMEDEIMRSIFHGSGSSQPAGLDNISGVNYVSVSSALQAATPPYGPYVDAWKKCAFDKFNDSNVTVVESTEAKAQRLKLYATDDQPLLLPSHMMDWNWVHCDSITNNGVYLGDFSKMRLWFRSFNIKLLERYAENLQIGYIMYARVAINVDYPGHFCRIDQITAAAPTT